MSLVRSQNSWPANDRSLIASYAVPGGRVALRSGDVSVILLACLHFWHDHVEPLYWPGIWGYAERLVRGSSTSLSNHASGTAVDANAPAHPLGTKISANFTPQQIDTLRYMIAWLEGAIRWGGDYKVRADGMHLEVDDGTTKIALIAQKVRDHGGRIPAPGSAAPLAPAKPGSHAAPAPAQAAGRRPQAPPTIAQGADSGWVFLVQDCLRLRADGKFGPQTAAAVRVQQARHGLTQDGIVGPWTWVSFIADVGTIRLGSAGHIGIEVLQNFLGFRGRDLDRQVGPGTAARIREVQAYGGLAQDGEVGPATREVLARG